MGIYLGDKVIANYYKLPDQTGKAGKALITNGETADWDDASSVYRYTADEEFVQDNLIVADSLNTAIPSTSEFSDAIWLYSSPVYPYVPISNQVSGTSYTFDKGGVVICNSPTNVTIASNEFASFTFSNFVGMLPVSIGTTVTTNITSYFSGY